MNPGERYATARRPNANQLATRRDTRRKQLAASSADNNTELDDAERVRRRSLIRWLK